MFKKKIIFIFLLTGLAWSFSASAGDTCPRDNGAGVGCNAAAGFYYCSASSGGSCTNLTSYNVGSIPTNLKTFCDDTSINRPACTPGVDCSNATSYNCGVPQACSPGYSLCNLAGTGNSSWPDSKCKANVSLPLGCQTYNQCTSVCSACSDGYELIGGICYGAAVKLGTDSVTATFLKNSANPFLTILSPGRVGIGTTSPEYKLDFGSDTGIQMNLRGGIITGLNWPASTTDAVPRYYVDDNFAPKYGGASLWGGAATSAIWSLNSGNVGIGLINPGVNASNNPTKFHVYTNSQSGTGVTIENASSSQLLGTELLLKSDNATRGNGVIMYNTGDKKAWGMGTTYGGSGKFQIGYVSDYTAQGTFQETETLRGDKGLLTVLSSGNVGIGDNNPTALLSLYSASGAMSGGIRMQGNVAGDISNIWTQDIYSKWLHTESTADAAAGYGRIDFETNAAANPTYPTRGGFSFKTAGAGQFVTFTNNGNVGIGTTLPGNPLEIKTSNNDILRLNRNGWTGGEEANILFSHNGSYNAKIGSWVEGGGSMVALRFFTVDAGTQSQKMVIRGNGNVGIGVTNPQAKLEIFTDSEPAINVNSRRIVGLPLTATEDSEAVSRKYLHDNFTSTSTISSSSFWAGSLTGNINNANSGNVGIGTTTPNTKLQVLGAIKSGGIGANGSLFLDSSADGGGGATLSYASASGLTISQIRGLASNIIMGGSGIEFQTEDSTSPYTKRTRMIIKHGDTGNVGIGINNPSSKLHVETATGGVQMTLKSADTTTGGASIKFARSVTGSAREWWAGIGVQSASDAGFSIYDATGAATRMYFKTDGNIGISTTNPTAKLQIQGTLKLQNVAASSPDANIRRLIHVASYNGGGSVSQTGTLIIKTPAATAHSMAKIKISGWSYGKAWDVIISGYLRPDGAGWTQTGGTVVTGNPPFELADVKLAADNTNDIFYILLGNSTTAFGYYASVSVDAESIYSDNLPSAGWDIYISASLPTYDAIVTPTASLYGSHNAFISGNVGIGGATTTRVKLDFASSTGDQIHVAGGQVAGLNSVPVRADHAVPLGYFTGIINNAFLNGGNSFAGTATLGTNDNNRLDIETYNTIRMTIANNGNVGIGTINPGNTFSVVGSTTGQGAPSLTDRTKGIASFQTATTTSGVQLNIGGYTASPYAIWLQASYSGNNQAYPIAINPLGGNVGIGTTTPQAKLEIASTTNIEGLRIISSNYSPFVIRNSANTADIFRIDQYGNITGGIGNSTAWTRSTTTNQLYVTDLNDKVGIGLTNPTSTLEVKSSGSGNQIRIWDNSWPDNEYVGYGIYGAMQTDELASFGYRYHIGGTSNSGIQLGTSASPWMTILNNGNVGIGTSTPGAMLELYKNGTPELRLTDVGNNYDTGNLQSQIMFYGRWWSGNTFAVNSAAIKILKDQSSGSGGSAMAFWTQDQSSTSISEKMRINRFGNVGIGTTDPDSRLRISGSGASNTPLTMIRAFNTIPYVAGNGLGAARIELGHGMLHGYIDAGAYSETDSSAGYLALGTRQATNNVTEAMRINIYGNVGIGTTNPAQKLEVNGNATIRSGSISRIFMGGVGGDNFGIAFSSSYPNYGMFYQEGSPDYIALSPNGGGTSSPVFIADQNGNVGIGVTSPQARLHISAGNDPAINVSSRRILGLPLSNTEDSEAVSLSYVHSNFVGKGLDRTAGYLTKWSSTSTIANSIVFETTGGIGIGTTDPGTYKLKVVGNVAVTGTLETQTGSDFAEEFRTEEVLEAGTVVVMGDLGYKSAKASLKAYDRTVIGIVSDSPSIIAGRVETKAGEHKAIIAMSGVVSVKATSANGQIRRGDLLVSSNKEGLAMKSDGSKPGTVIGKALEDLSSKQGTIKVLINLQ